jgi:hypothetical protein
LGPLGRTLGITGKGSSVLKGDWPRWSVAYLQMFSSTRSIHRRYFFKELISPYNIIKFHRKRIKWRSVHSSIRINQRNFVHFCWWKLYKIPGQNKLWMHFHGEIKHWVIFHGWNVFWLETTWNFIPLFHSSAMNFI